MQLQIHPSEKNRYPLKGILIRGDQLLYCLQQLQSLEIDISTTAVYPLPGAIPNSFWGCMVPNPMSHLPAHRGSETICQCVQQRLYIPQYADLFPRLSEEELEKLFPTPHFFHPETGLVSLDIPIDFASVLSVNPNNEILFRKPEQGAFIPTQIKMLEIVPLTPEDALQVMERNKFPEKKKFDDRPLAWHETLKMHLLRGILKGTQSQTGSQEKGRGNNKLMEFLEKMFPTHNTGERLLQQLDELERRNNSEMEKLMKLFKNDPDEALKYAIPLDEQGSNRGGSTGLFTLSQRWHNFNLFGNPSGGSGNTIFTDDAYMKLQQQYYDTAKRLETEGKHDKAAFVYMKLLKNNHMAASTLEAGSLYTEAASVYLKYLNNKQKAAECYEKGHMTSQAISLYKELNKKEKVGDLYLTLNKREEAFQFYHEVADEHIASGKYVQAALVYRYKMEDTASAQNLLLKGWREDKDAYNCLNNYFTNITDLPTRRQAVMDVYKHETNESNKPVFLQALVHEYKKNPDLQPEARKMAYEIIAELVMAQPELIDRLRDFNADSSLSKDIVRYKNERTRNSRLLV